MKSFTNLTELKRLHFDALPSAALMELCELLTGIDVISYDKYGFSCFQYTAGSTFEDSTLTILVQNKLSDAETGYTELTGQMNIANNLNI